jgi:periplasmic divalent cation tolerance protein
MENIVVNITCGNMEEAEKISKALVEEKLVACANILGGIKSIFWWEGKVERSPEVAVTMKTVRNNFDKVAARVRELHSYQVPEIIALPIVEGSKDYLQWIENSVLCK